MEFLANNIDQVGRNIIIERKNKTLDLYIKLFLQKIPFQKRINLWMFQTSTE